MLSQCNEKAIKIANGRVIMHGTVLILAILFFNTCSKYVHSGWDILATCANTVEPVYSVHPRAKNIWPC